MYLFTKSISLSERLLERAFSDLRLAKLLNEDELAVSVRLFDVIEEIVEELLKELPEDANTIAVFVHGDDMHQIARDLEVKGKVLPVRFDYVMKGYPEGSICLGYGQGNLENFKIPPAGWLEE